MSKLDEFERDLVGDLGEDSGTRGPVFSPEETERRADGRRWLVIKGRKIPGEPQPHIYLPEKDPSPE